MLTYKWIDINSDFETKYGMRKEIAKPVADEDMTKLIEFIGDDCTDEDEKYLANLWLAKFNHYWDKNPRAENSKPKRKVVPVDRLKAAVGPQVKKASKAKVCVPIIIIIDLISNIHYYLFIITIEVDFKWRQ